MLPEKLVLAQSVCTRLCHDLGGPIGALGAAVELLEAEARQGGAADAMDVARDAVRVIDRRLRFLRASLGGCGDCGKDEIATMAEGLTLGRRATIDLDGLADGLHLPPVPAQALLLAMWVAMEALPRGGAVRVAGRSGAELSVWPDGAGAAWPPALAATIAGDSLAPGPRALPALMLGLVAAAGRVRLDLPLGAGGLVPPLILAAPGA